ncbi:MAG: RNA polymerase sigma factor [Pseudomonadales bacterium]
MQSDQELLQRIDRGDEDALGELYDLYYKLMSRFVLGITHDAQLTLEVINDVFMVVWDKAGSFRGDSAVSTWVLGIAYKKSLKAATKQRWPLPLDAIADAADEGEIEKVIRDQEIRKVLSKLSPEHRAVVELSYYFGYSYREIADILVCPENTVKTRMFHARRMLRSLLEA